MLPFGISSLDQINEIYKKFVVDTKNLFLNHQGKFSPIRLSSPANSPRRNMLNSPIRMNSPSYNINSPFRFNSPVYIANSPRRINSPICAFSPYDDKNEENSIYENYAFSPLRKENNVDSQGNSPKNSDSPNSYLRFVKQESLIKNFSLIKIKKH